MRVSIDQIPRWLDVTLLSYLETLKRGRRIMDGDDPIVWVDSEDRSVPTEVVADLLREELEGRLAGYERDFSTGGEAAERHLRLGLAKVDHL